MKTIKIKNRDGLIRTGSILAEHEDSKRRHWVTVLCENDDVETLPASNIIYTNLGGPGGGHRCRKQTIAFGRAQHGLVICDDQRITRITERKQHTERTNPKERGEKMNFGLFYNSIVNRLDFEQKAYLSNMHCEINDLKQARIRDASREKQLLEKIEQLEKELENERDAHSKTLMTLCD